MKANIKESLMIILKGYKENVVSEEEVLTLIETIMDNYATNTITYPLYNSNTPWLNPPFTVTCTSNPNNCEFPPYPGECTRIQSMKIEKKYKLTDETFPLIGHTLYRIEALKDFSDVKKGDKGGFVESEENLSHDGDCWVYDTAKVYGNAMVYDTAKVYGNASIYGDALIYGNAEVFGNAKVLTHASICDNAKVWGNAEVYGNASIYGDARVFGNAVIHGRAEVGGDAKVADNADYIVFKNWWSSGRYFTWTRSNNMWSVGCFYGTGEELISKAYKDSELSGREYERVVKYVESILKE